MNIFTVHPRKAQPAHAPFCEHQARHDGLCTSATVTATVAGRTITAWAVGDPDKAPAIVLDGLGVLDGERLTLDDLNTLTEVVISLGFTIEPRFGHGAGTVSP